MHQLLSQIVATGAESSGRHAANPELRDTVAMTLDSEEVRTLRIQKIYYHLCKTGLPPRYGGHWRLFLVLEENEMQVKSIELNSQRLGLGESFATRLFIASRPFEFSTANNLNEFLINLPTFPTVQEAIALLLEKRRDKYTLNSEGSGCRFWCETVLADFEERGWVYPGTHEWAVDYGRKIAAKYPDLLPLVAVQGVFEE